MTTHRSKGLNHRLATARDRARHGDDVVIVVERLAHIGHMMAELQAGRGAADIVDVHRASGVQAIRFRGGGRIRFRSAYNPDSLRGLSHVDLFLVDPRVATTTALEENMRLACRDSTSSPTIIRPGDRLTIGGKPR